MSALEVFQYKDAQVRTVDVDGDAWFVLADLCRVLDLTNPSVVAQGIDADALSTAEVIDSMRRFQTVRIVSEAGMYQVAFLSRKPEAALFRRWVTNEVLPALRRTGTYAVPQTREQRLAAAVLDANVVIAEAHAEIAVLTPRAEAWDELAAADGDYSVADAAKMLARAGIETGPQRLFDYLATAGWTFRGADKRPRAYAGFVSRGYLAERPMSHPHPKTGGTVIDAPQIRVTLTGLQKLHERLSKQTLQGALAS